MHTYPIAFIIKTESNNKKMNTLEHMIYMARGANHIIRDGCVNMIVTAKEGYSPERADDCVTDADFRAQRMYVEYIRQHFPTYGLIAEEEGLCIPCTDPEADLYFTVDPIDGTKAFVRNASQGVGTMIALVRNSETIAAVIGDPNTDELYTFGENDPGTRHRFGVQTRLVPNLAPLATQYVLLKDAAHKHPPFLHPALSGELFKDMEIVSGSIGILMTRLWKGEVGGVILRPVPATPWDQTPIIGFCKKLGYRFFKVDDRDTVTELTCENSTVTIPRIHYELIIHESHIPELQNWLRLG